MDSLETVTEQPAVACLGDSDKARFSLLLFFGREYNNEIKNQVINKLGTYCFQDSLYSTFWNRAYGLVQRICGLSYFKTTCIRLNASPVLFSNALPSPIPNSLSESEKKQRRLAIPDNDISSYIEGIFQMPVIKRVRFVVLSGVENQTVFGRSTRLIHKECKQRGIVVSEISYLGSRIKNDVIDRTLSKLERHKICRTVAAFYEEMREA